MKQTNKLLLLLLTLGWFNLQAQCEYEEQNGLVIIEAENTTSPYDLWFLKTDVTNYKGSGHLEFGGNTTTNGTPKSPLVYTFKIIEGGTYQLALRARKRITPPDESDKSNDCYVRVEGDYDESPNAGDTHQDDARKSALETNTKIYGGNTDSWGWASLLDLGGDINKRSPKYVFKAGETYTFVMSGRSKQFNVDRIMFYRLSDHSTAEARTIQETIDETACSTQAGVQGVTPSGVALEGELRRWHKTTLICDGPDTNEEATTNPFTDYRLDVTFLHSTGKTIVVPGYYAGCNDATDGCTSGNKWKVHFVPGLTGSWFYSFAFTKGSNVATNGGGITAGFFDAKTGDFTITESNKTDRDFRAPEKGVLAYVGEHYLQFTGTGGDSPNGNYFVKAGADSPENMLAYDDFDGTPNRGGRRKSWTPHQQDYLASDASEYTWGSGDGTEILGVVNYLSNKGVNAFSFLTLSLHGDDENVFPHLMKVDENTYNDYNDEQQWNIGVHHDRFDVSKLAQWEKVFEYADKKGMFLHFKTMETENDNIMDNDTFGNERKIYYRELIARFSHHLALNWNLTEESTLTDAVVRETSTYIKNVDPYNHLRVMHTYPGQQSSKYTPQLGNASDLTGASIQIGKDEVHTVVSTWVNNSAAAGKKWVVSNDEQGNAVTGVNVDGIEDDLVRDEVLWGTLMAGGMGVEYYYGYNTGETDLSAENHRSRDLKYTHASYALQFFENYLIDDVADMVSNDGITTDTNDYVYTKPGEIYVVYRPNGGTTNITLPSSTWTVQWYNPRTGGVLTNGVSITNSLVAPDTNDWVALITTNGFVSSCKMTSNIEAECYDSMSGIQTQLSSEGTDNIGWIEDGDWTSYNDIDLTGTNSISARVASNSAGGTIEVRLGSITGTLIATLSVSNTGGDQVWDTVSANISSVTGVNDIYLVFRGGTGYLFNINYFGFFTNTLSIDDRSIFKAITFPNPVDNELTVKFNSYNAETSIVLYAVNGQKILEAKPNEEEVKLNLSKLNSGIYILMLNNKFESVTKKIVKL